MKIKSILTMIVVLLTVQLLRGQSTGNPVTDLLLSAYSERNYTTQLVTDQQLDIILNCGIKAPSARNQQPWRFTVIKDEAAIKEIISDAVAGDVEKPVDAVSSATPRKAFDEIVNFKK